MKRLAGRSCVFFATGCLLAAASGAAPHGLSVSLDDFLRLDLATGEFVPVGETGLAEWVGSLAFGPDGGLYGVGEDDGVAALLRFDPATGAGVRIATLPELGYAGGLAATGDGALWLTAGAQLYRVDPATGVVSAPVSLGDDDVGTLASRSGELYGFAFGRHFERIDPATGAREPVFTFEGAGFEWIVGADFDDDGVLWFLTSQVVGLVTVVNLAVYRVDDLETGVWEQTFAEGISFFDTGAWMGSLAIPPGEPPPVAAIDVPTLGGGALAVLGLAIAGTGVAVLRRRQPASRSPKQGLHTKAVPAPR